MVRGRRFGGVLLSLGLAGCSGVTPGEPQGTERGAIVGGANDTTHKGVFGIVIQNQALCSGSLIAPNLILTARHCVADLSTGDGDVNCTTSTFGTPYPASGFDLTWAQNLNANVAGSSVYGATEVRVPPDDLVCGNDVALIFLDANVPASSAATIEPRVDDMPVTGEPFDAVGYGLNNPNDAQGTSAGIRRIASGQQVACVGAVECLGTRAKNDEWAAYAQICHGDSGGPALDADGKVIGVASRADADCVLGLYGTVASWKSFIVDAAIDAAADGGYDPPAWTGVAPTGTGGGSGTGGTAGSAGTGGSTGGTGGSMSAGTGGSMSGGSGGRASGSGGTTGSAGKATMPMMDAGTPPPDDAGTELGPALGEECQSFCSGDLLCYASTGMPPGECVPPCSSDDTTCPSKYKCDEDLGACVPKQSSDDEEVTHSGGCGCRVTDGPQSSASWTSLGLFALVGALVRRRRRS